MTQKIEFIVPGNPQALKRHRTFTKGTFTGTYDPSKDDKSNFLAKAMQNRPQTPLERPILLKLYFYFQRPKAHYGTGSKAGILKDTAPVWHTKTPDADNLVKFVCDSLNKIFWRDDSYVCALVVHKKYDEVPRVHIIILYEED